MRQFLFAASLMSIITVTTPAEAEITITQVEYGAGVLVVRGETSQPNQRVTLDGRYRTRTDRYKEFRFRIRYLPRNCSVTIRAGQDVRPARVANCDILLPRAGTASPDSELSSGQTQSGARMRVVRQSCSKGEECRVLCEEGEFAVNAHCPGGEAKILAERAITCAGRTSSQIIAYCLAPGK